MEITATGFYKRALPSPPAIEFTSMEGKKLFIESIQNGTAEGFYKLISNFQTQSEPAYCGLASLSMVLNALAIDPGRTWKAPWRWYDESMLDCCEPLENVKANGISIGKLVCLAHCAGAKVEAFRTNQSTIDAFRKYVIQCSASDDCHLISSYHRGALKQTGTGHFSPIGGYHAAKDMALILDVARFKYPPHWVPLEILWEAMEYIDEETGLHRGFMLVSRPHRESGLLYKLSCKNESWASISKYLLDDIPFLLKAEEAKDVHQLLHTIFASLPPDYRELITGISEVQKQDEDDENLSPEDKARFALKECVLKQIHKTPFFKHVAASLLPLASFCSKKSTNTGLENDFHRICMTIFCQGAQVEGNLACSEGYYCHQSCVPCLKTNGCKSVPAVYETLVNGNSEREVGMLLCLCQINCSFRCSVTRTDSMNNSTASEVLTALILAVPRETWAGIRDDRLSKEIHRLVSTEDLPTLLQEEVLHLRRQLHLMKRCQDNRVEEELGSPLS